MTYSTYKLLNYIRMDILCWNLPEVSFLINVSRRY